MKCGAFRLSGKVSFRNDGVFLLHDFRVLFKTVVSVKDVLRSEPCSFTCLFRRRSLPVGMDLWCEGVGPTFGAHVTFVFVLH
jgi:hypothetical protein